MPQNNDINQNTFFNEDHNLVSGINSAHNKRANFANEKNKFASLSNGDEIGGYRGFGWAQLFRVGSVSSVNSNVVGP